MSKKQFLELLIKTFGLIPKDIQHYRTDGCDGQYEVKTGWKGSGLDKDGGVVVSFFEPDGFEAAVFEIINQAQREGEKPVFGC